MRQLAHAIVPVVRARRDPHDVVDQVSHIIHASCWIPGTGKEESGTNSKINRRLSVLIYFFK